VPRSFLVYWLPDQIRAAIKDGLLKHAASEQFGRVARGDVLWITGKGPTEPLITVGPLHVAEIVSQRKAERRFQCPLWGARYHALCTPDTETAACEVPLTPILRDLEFDSRRSPRLDLQKPLGQQLQAMRQLTEPSAETLAKLWYDTTQVALTEIQRKLDSYERLDQAAVVLARREQAILRQYLFHGREFGICDICGENLPVSLLVAAHIKPRAKCSDTERRDHINNVVSMCLLGCDALFERGWVVVRNGKVRVRMRRNSSDRLDRFLKQLEGRRTVAWKEDRVKYFTWHAQNVGKDSGLTV